MTIQTPIAQTIETIEFADLYIDDLNPRSEVSDDETQSLADNIKAAGLIHNLAGYRTDGRDRVGIVAGGRRLRALALLQDDPRFTAVPVVVTTSYETATLWATSENAQRKALTPAEEIRDFGKLDADGLKAAQIAVAYGVTEKHVYRRVALSGLAEPILAALQAEEINLSQASAFTISNDAELSLNVLEQVKSAYHNVTDYQIKRMLKPSAVNATTDRCASFVGVEAYKEAGGTVSGDLFADVQLMDDPEILETAFLAKLTAVADEFAIANGLKWTRPINDDFVYRDYGQDQGFGRIYPIEEDLTEEEAERYDELSELAEGEAIDEAGATDLAALQAKIDGQFSDEQKAFCGAVAYVNHSGGLQFFTGLVDPEDCADAEQAGILAKSMHQKPTTTKSAISDKLRGDLRNMETGARQNAMLDDPKLALHLLAFQLSGNMGYSTAFGLRKDTVPNMPETETGFELDKRLTTPLKTADHENMAVAFAAFRKRGDKKIMEILNRYLISQLSVGDTDLGGMLDGLISKQTRDTFTPTAENFFKRVGGPYLNSLWNELLGLSENDDAAKVFASQKKADKAAQFEKLFNDPDTRSALGVTDKQDARIAAWMPAGMI